MDEPRCGLRCLKPRLYDHVRCADLTGADQRAIPELYTILGLVLPPGQDGGDKVSGSRDKPLGFRTDVYDHMRNIRDTLTEWVDYVVEERSVTSPQIPQQRRHRRFIVGTAGTTRVEQKPDRDRDALRIVTYTTFLERHHEWLTRRDIGLDYGEEIRTLAHRARQLAQLYPARPVIKAGVPCRNDRCGALGLIQVPGSKYIECPACGNLLTGPEYTDWVALNAHYAKTKGKTA